MGEENFEKIKEFTIKEACLTDEVLTRKTRIEEDLGITGADAVEFIIAFGKHFNVDVSKFMSGDYFEPEGMNWSITKTTIPNKQTLTLGHLEKSLLKGKLDETILTP